MINKQTIAGKEYELFVLINYKTKEKILCSWDDYTPVLFGQKVNYIGVTNGLGGYHTMLAKGFIDRRFIKGSWMDDKVGLWIHNNQGKLINENRQKYNRLFWSKQLLYFKSLAIRKSKKDKKGYVDIYLYTLNFIKTNNILTDIESR